MVFYCSCPNQKTDETSNHKNFLCFIFSSQDAANEAEKKAAEAEKEKAEKKAEAEKKAAEAKQASDAAAAIE